jgi:hypothetical protein
MDRQQFDQLARALAQGRLPRRGVLRVLASGMLAPAGVTTLVDAIGQAKGDAQVRSEADRNRRHRQAQCKRANSKCQYKAGNNRTIPRRRHCKRCCETFRKVSAIVGRCCIAEGQPCETAAQCCLESCSAGLCQPTTSQVPPPSFPEEPILTVPPGVPAPPPPPPACVAYGESCTQSAECCFPESGVQCNGGLCRFT